MLATLIALTACAGASDPTVQAGDEQSGPLAQIDGGESLAGNGAVLRGTEVGAVIPRPELALEDTTGATFDLQQRPPEELTAVFFGYTRCPDVCPTTMADLAAARRALPPELRDKVQVVFVTEDPRVDTAPVVRRWLDGFDEDFIGLLGGGKRTRQVLSELKASPTEINRGAAAAIGEVEHVGSVYAFYGERVVVYTGGTTSQQYAEDFSELLQSS